ncbi:MAG TPA: superoxide dismutase family protein [Rhodocyclaceae bacterium]|jgi:Cu-Zn family superoxide dismutase|nr:superoxide dismutase family protein [Rhodocyclaceae bacterium]HNL20937.1 superoxide dismutase family protein [Rhodocyclaceae bacterium]HNM79893.1 superoxide dismutase family protein [Rhodocyclaceae bacterium]HNP03302.1 superoxide dismutase family protein [Rhodocyclaceae bacterium]
MTRIHPIAFVLPLILAAGCASTGGGGASATATLSPTKGNTTAGAVTFVQNGAQVRVVAEISGLTPGPHGFHVHEKGDCSAPDGTSAGGHFNPTGKSHGHPNQGEHHVGDFPQLVADASGMARLTFSTPDLAVGSGATNVIGRAVIVHGGVDDFKSQPAGNSGPRVACGVINAR